ncbi:MAG: peptidase inhibitor family I36 protein [Propionibacteriaceae bacterium]|jgi:murein DD-endopeptidase MepM/ murein hydrolase activator NlpD|nr:peptidase inhibitor family I36 protein [Propionibacteriaceae bacterium]
MVSSRKLAMLAGSVLLAVGFSFSGMPSAQAASRNGVCDNGEFCYSYNSGFKGSVSDFTGSLANYGTTQPSCYDFKGAGAGKGRCIKNDAASVWNRTGQTVRVYYNSNYGGSYQDFAPGVQGNLNSTLKNNNASHKLIGSSSSGSGSSSSGSTNNCLSSVLYGTNSSRLTCGFDGYTTTSGRHEGIDMARSVGAPIYSLTNGEVISVREGKTGSGGLSTIAIYAARENKTVIYLHADPNISVGQTVTKGTRIGYESWRGVSGSSGAHTHVEVRNGRQTYAAKSVGDYTLQNSNPTSWWTGLGYRIC